MTKPAKMGIPCLGLNGGSTFKQTEALEYAVVLYGVK